MLHRAALRSASVLTVTALTGILFPTTVSAQEQPSLLGDTVKKVVLDPTTYAPAIIAYDATMRDWNSSQPFFRNGYVEHNERFTRTGLPNDLPISYEAGQSRILSDALVTLEISVVNNVADRLFERMLLTRFPDHPKLVRALGWVERGAFASYMSYSLSARHYRQAAANTQRAQQLGFR